MDTLIAASIAAIITVIGTLLRVSGQMGRLTESVRSQDARLSRIEAVLFGWLGHDRTKS